MEPTKHEQEQAFYHAVAHILGCEYAYAPWPFETRNRWNHRVLGNGRFVNHGMVRRFSSSLIHVSLRQPILTAHYTSEQAALEAIAQAVKNSKNSG